MTEVNCEHQKFDKPFILNRMCMIDWLIHLKHTLSFCDETFFLCISIFDKVLITYLNEDTSLNKNDFHFIGIVSLFIAYKYLEIQPLSIDYIKEQIGKNKYTKEEIFSFEWQILKILQFKMPKNNFNEILYSKYQNLTKHKSFMNVVKTTYIFSIYDFYLTNFLNFTKLVKAIICYSLKFLKNHFLNGNLNDELLHGLKSEFEQEKDILEKLNFIKFFNRENSNYKKICFLFKHFKKVVLENNIFCK